MPKDWELLELEEVSKVVDSLHKTPEFTDSGYPMVRAADVKGGFLDISEAQLVSKDDFLDFTRNHKPQQGDIVLSRVGSYFNFSYAKDGKDFCIGQNTSIIVPEIDSRFLYYSLISPLVQDQVERSLVGTSQKTLSLKYIRALKIPTPSPVVQRAIAGILGALDDKIEVNRRMNVTLESMARAVFRQWFVENEEVENWDIAVLNDLAESILGGDWGKDTNEGGALSPAFCIRGADIPDLQAGGMGKMPLRYLKPSSLEKRQLQHGDIVVEISGGSPTQSTGRPVFISDTLLRRLEHPLVASNFCRVFRPKDPTVSNFVYFWLRWHYSRDDFFQFENGTTGIKNFAFTIFCDQYTLNLPPKKLLEKYHQFTTTILEAMQSNAKESRTLASLRDSLLPRLMRGEVRVKDVEKEL